MSEYSRESAIPIHHSSYNLFFFAAIWLASSVRVESQSWSSVVNQAKSHVDFALTESRSDELPRIQSLGKLVSIEGKTGAPGTLRELAEDENGPELRLSDGPGISPSMPASEFKFPRLSCVCQEIYSNYRTDENALTYMPGNGDQFGWISLESQPYVARGYRSGFTNSINMHLLSGPASVPLPPRLYDFSLGYQKRGRAVDVLSYDLAASLGVFSDFEDSARDGVRFPGHAVGMLHYTPEFDVVFGVDYLSRDDYKILPVAGFSLRPIWMQNLRFDLVFPRPRIDYSLSQDKKLYLAGRLGGGSWDIEFPNDNNDVMTYRDLQLLVGFERRDERGNQSVWEFGYVFDRQLSFRTLTGETQFDDAFVFRIVTRK
jgi:hypothetical protein